MVRLGGCLPRSDEAAGRGLQRGARAESLPLQRLYESGLPLAGTKAGHDQTYQRVRSALTRMVKAIEGKKVNIHAAFLEFKSGQLRFLGLCARPRRSLRLKHYWFGA